MQRVVPSAMKREQVLGSTGFIWEREYCHRSRMGELRKKFVHAGEEGPKSCRAAIKTGSFGQDDTDTLPATLLLSENMVAARAHVTL